jgi:pimeloyl-ACP methyl ester carboxylesterase
MQIVTTITSDGFQFSGLLSEPPEKCSTMIIHIHGMASDFYSSQFQKIAHEQYPLHGLAYCSGENRGTHSSTTFKTNDGQVIGGNSFEKLEDSVADIGAWVDFAHNRGYKHIWLQGDSLGPSKIAYFLDHNKNYSITGAIWISPSDMYGLVRDPEGIKDHELLLPEAKQLVSQEKNIQLLSNKLWEEYYLSAATYLNFFDEGSAMAIFNYGAPELGWDVVNNISVPVIAFTGTKDDGIEPVIEPHEAMRLLEKQLRNSPKVKTVVFENAAHDFEGFETQIIENTIQFILETGN